MYTFIAGTGKTVPFWCGKRIIRKYFLIIMAKGAKPEEFKCPDKFNMKGYPEGYQFTRQRHDIRAFSFLNDRKKASQNAKLTHNAILMNTTEWGVVLYIKEWVVRITH
jgi:hypothetical protein